MPVFLKLKVNNVKIEQFLPLIAIQSLDSCEELDVLLSGKLIVDRIELRTDTNCGEDFID